MLNTRQVAGLLYSMGHTFDNLDSTYLATEEFLSTSDPHAIGSRADLDLLEDLRDAAAYTLHHDYSHGLDVDFIRGINAQLRRTAALEPGVLRDRANIMVHTMAGDYTPAVPDAARIKGILDAANKGPGTPADAARLFASLARMQPFGDGNKRTALLAANGLLLMRGEDKAMIVPTTDPERHEFNKLLGDWYMKGDPAVIDRLVDFNMQVDGLDDYGHPLFIASNTADQPAAPERARSAAR
ncbi:Fic family protein [Bifidobacterium pseudolongum]|uniref:Fic family protein n=1 Tax=Bifidobacterium pseudolongum TaxID=1694 RepID=UPI003514F301